ncbi:hypothetical protein A2316_01800 [Candidatus Falkowbacteria bacterium RIFOXYB2_FULL_38_15]|uniref:Putative amidase domain-containing protein n=1 Tax=Candidatus Falkowbacteria bacterium RIFOXYA2_FULL_38_12 TaxID=1797993 RepID=A0A1F5S2A4_9BACT|nr:MAG: hypothetical protein A2257_03580 [Candidatus Falkowbacteria bacterium RIFOXYA2_FULL_38_12]OGF32685.1 MAG: hypothetical protein A2316_01800 [Candidatus Falkowbacteria bacterium RIFOXYB2_FULL_38_15]OGF42089.1 MAG: hypothetical protein A2555_01695 [Candidatus Falkowbacteria bacterium RIFOXYD2_FULL_39_16]
MCKIPKKKYLTFLLVLATLFFLSSPIINAEDNKFKLASKESLKEYYESEDENFYDYIPKELLQKYGATINKIDDLIKNGNYIGGVLSTNNEFSLNYYIKWIQVAIFPYIKDKKFTNEVNLFLSDASEYVINKEKIKKRWEKLGGEPQSTVWRDGKDNKISSVRIAIDGLGYNATKAVEYAKKWTDNTRELRNPNYSYYIGRFDCTDFVSQVLHDSTAGNLSEIRIDHWGFDYDDLDNWYYANGFLNPPSWTWGGAQNFYSHLGSYRRNITRLTNWRDVRVGDIIQWDMTPSNRTVDIGHSTVVTKIERGNYYLTYHSTDKEDEPITTFTSSGYIPYAWAINH